MYKLDHNLQVIPPQACAWAFVQIVEPIEMPQCVEDRLCSGWAVRRIRRLGEECPETNPDLHHSSLCCTTMTRWWVYIHGRTNYNHYKYSFVLRHY